MGLGGRAGKGVAVRLCLFTHTPKPLHILLSHLLVEEAVDQEDVDSLQDIGDGESIGDDGSDRFLYYFSEKEAKAPGTAQEEELSNGFKRQHPCVLYLGHIFIEGRKSVSQNPQGYRVKD